MADITLTVDVSSLADAKTKLKEFQKEISKNNGVLGLSNALGQVEKNISSLITAQGKGRITARAFDEALIGQRKALQTLGISYGEAKSSVEGLVAALRSQEAARQAAEAAKQLARAQEEAALATKKLADRQKELRLRFVEGYAAFDRNRKTIRDLREALQKGIITTDQYRAAVQRLREEQQRQTVAGNQATLGLNRTAVITQQAGYQVGDFFVQVQGGTNVLVAFGQQATQLVGTFAMLAKTTKAIAMFSGLGVLIAIGTAIGSAMMRASGASETLTQSIEKLGSSSEKVKSTFELLKDKTLQNRFGSLANEVSALSALMLDLDNSAQLKNLSGSLDKLEKAANASWMRYFGEGASNILKFFDPFTDMKSWAQIEEEAFQTLGFQMARSQFLSYTDEMQRLAKSGDRAGVIEAYNRFLADATDNGTSVDKITKSGYEMLDVYQKAFLKMAEMVALLDGSAAAAERSAAAEQRRFEAITLHNALLQTQADLNKQRDDGVKAILDSRDRELSQMRDQITLSRLSIVYGKDSVQVADMQAKIEEKVARAKFQAAGLNGNLLDEAMRIYKVSVDISEEADLLSEGLTKSAVEALKLANINLKGPLSEAAKQAAIIAGNMGIAFSAAVGLQQTWALAQSGEDGRGTQRQGRADVAALRTAETLKRMGINPDGTWAKKTKESGAVPGKIDTQEEYINKLIREFDLKKKTLSMSDEQAKKAEFIFNMDEKIATMKTKMSEDQIAALKAEALAAYDVYTALEKWQDIIDKVESTIEDAFMSMVDGSKSVSEAFKGMLREILLDIYRQQVAKPISSGISDIISGFLGGFGGSAPTSSIRPKPNPRMANGGAWNSGVQMFANGGVVNSPTAFRHSSGLGVMGEAGPEAIMPLKRGKNGQLGVQVDGNSSGAVNVTQVFNFSANGDESVKKIIAQAAPQIAMMTQQQIMDSRRRGGSMKATFG